MFCQRCGAQIPEDSTTCPRCGTSAIIISPLANIPTPGGSAAPPPPSEQFGPLPPWQPPAPMQGSISPGGPLSVRPPSPPITQRFFGPLPQPGVPLVHRNRVQRWLLSRMRQSAASSVWLGAVIGALVAFALVLAFSIIFSLTLGHTLDQSFFNSLSTGQTGVIFGSDTNSSFLYSNPLFLMAYAHRTTIDLHLSLGASGISASASEGVTPPVSLLLLLRITIIAASSASRAVPPLVSSTGCSCSSSAWQPPSACLSVCKASLAFQQTPPSPPTASPLSSVDCFVESFLEL